MWNAEAMRHATRISDRLGAAAFVFGARNTILWPYLHGYADDLVALLAQQISRDAGVHSPAHPQYDAVFGSIHAKQRISTNSQLSQWRRKLLRNLPRNGVAGAPPSSLTARLTNGLPLNVKRQG